MLVPNRLIISALARSMNARIALFGMLAPQALPVAAPALLGIPPLSTETMTPREAQARYGFDVPGEAHTDMRDKQRRRVLEDGLAPTEEGLKESQAHIGSMDVRRPAMLG